MNMWPFLEQIQAKLYMTLRHKTKGWELIRSNDNNAIIDSAYQPVLHQFSSNFLGGIKKKSRSPHIFSYFLIVESELSVKAQ